jgi:hypothetical protein
MQKPYGAILKYFFIIILWLLNTEITRGHSWSLVVTRGHSCVLLDKIFHFSRAAPLQNALMASSVKTSADKRFYIEL